MKKNILLLCSVALLLFSCDDKSKKEEVVEPKVEFKLNHTEIKLNHAKTEQLSLKQFQNGVTWSSSNEYVASVSASGLVTANCIGKAEIMAKKGEDSAVCTVTVTQLYSTYEEPNLTLWGKSKAEVEAVVGEPNYPETFTYWDVDDESIPTVYNFTDDKLTSIVVDYGMLIDYNEIEYSEELVNNIRSFLEERYIKTEAGAFINAVSAESATFSVELTDDASKPSIEITYKAL